MTDYRTYSSYAVLCELSSREFRKKLGLFPEEMRYYAILANSIIGAGNAARVKETPEAVVQDSRDFVERLLEVAGPAGDDVFREILETYLIETMKDELRYCCPNCVNFNKCLDIDNLSVGRLFERRTKGEDTDELKGEISNEVARAFLNTPYMDTDRAHLLCSAFRHQYSASGLGEVFSRYVSIAGELRDSYGIDYRKIQQEMISINSVFYERSKEAGNRQGE